MSEAQITAQPDTATVPEIFKFRFKKDKLGNKRPDLELKVPVLSMSGLIDVLNKGGKGAELVLESLSDTVRQVVANWVAETKPEDATQEKLPLNLFSWEAIANQDKKDRRTVTIDDETWAAFGGDYVEVMKRVRPNLTEE